VKSWVEIAEQRLATNYRLLSAAAGAETGVLAVVKANAYGHGADLCAPVLARAGAQWLGVADAAEGSAVRHALTAAGIENARLPRILTMCGELGDDVASLLQHALTPVVWRRRQMQALVQAVARHRSGPPLAVHLEIDTGMSRQGVAPGDDLRALLQWFKEQPTLRLDGVMTHFASAEVAGASQTIEQRERFEQAIAAVADSGLRPAWIHVGTSSTIDTQDANHNLAWLRDLADRLGARAMVRAGIALYGYCLPLETASPKGEAPSAASSVRHDLQPVMTWKTRIIDLREVQAGDSIGYNATFSAPHPMRLALLPIGYSDGLRRELSASNANPGGWVIVRGQRAPIVGRISMNLTVVDVTGIPGVAIADEVVLLGDGVTADDHARLAHTISYEILCGVRSS
jgi:alanine racemase